MELTAENYYSRSQERTENWRAKQRQWLNFVENGK